MNILNELYEIICNNVKSAKKKISIVNFMHYLMGENYETPLSDATLYNIYKKDRNLSYDNLNKLAMSKDRGISRLHQYIPEEINTSALLNASKKLLDKCFIHSSENSAKDDTLSSVMNKLVFLHFFYTTNPNTLFLPNEKASCKNYIHWKEMEHSITSVLKSNNLIFLTGNPGSGKKQLLINSLPKYCLKSHSDIYWLDAPASSAIPLERQLLNIHFWGMGKEILLKDELLNLLTRKESSSLLIIDRPIMTEDDLLFCKNYLYNMKLKIIITTLHKALPSEFTVLNIDNRPTDNLIKIFFKNSPTSDFTTEELYTLFNITSNNVHALTMTALALSKKDSTFTKKIALNESEWIWYRQNTPKMHSSYHNSGQKTGQLLPVLIRRILFHYDSNFLIEYASKLSIWTKTPISKKLLITKWDESVISECIMCGILQYHDKSMQKLYMPHLISDAIWSYCPIDYDSYITQISQLLTDIEYGKQLSVSYADLYQIIFNMILRFHFQVTTMPSRPNKNFKNTFNNWNELLTKLIVRYMNLGNYQYALNVLPYLYFSRNKKGELNSLSELQTAIQTLLYKQASYMKSENIISDLENLIIFISDFKEKYNFSEPGVKILQHLCSLIMEDMSNCIIDTTLVIIEQKSVDTYHSLLHCLEKLYALFNDYDPYYSLLLKFVYHYTSAIFEPENASSYLREGSECKDLLLCKDSAPHAVLQVNGLCIYFNTILLYEGVYSQEFKKIIEWQYNNLYSMFKNSIWPYHSSYIFYSCTFLLATLLPPYFCQPHTYEHLEDSLKLYKSFCLTQLSLPSEKTDKYNALVESKIKELHEYVSHSENFS